VSGGLAATDTLTAAGGTDILNISAAMTVTDAAFTLVTDLENITMGDVAVNLTAGSLAEAAGVVSIVTGNATNTVDASGRSTTALTLTGGTGADTLTGGDGIDTFDGNAGADIITGGKGNDIIVGDGGADVIHFAATALLNGTDTVTFVTADDKFNVSAIGTLTMLDTAIAIAATADVNITNKVVNLNDVNGATSGDTATELAALINGNGDAMKLDAGGKAIILQGYAVDADDTMNIWLVDDSLDGVNGTVATGDITKIATLGTFQSTLTGDNFVFS
jgi:Ca2+-binding RTX toxin-like protein